MLVDNIKFKTYDLDNKFTIYERIAYIKNVIPKYIYIYKLKKSDNLKTINLINIAETNDINKMAELYTQIKSQIPIELDEYNSTVLDVYDYCMIWYCFNLQKNYNQYYEFQFIQQCESPELSIVYERIKNDYETFINSYNNLLNEFKEKMQLLLEINTELDNTKPVYSTDVEPTKITLEVEFDVEYDIYQLFNTIQTNNRIPFCILKTNTHTFYKILKGFTPFNSWIYTHTINNKMYMKVLNVDIDINNKLKPEIYYSNVELSFESKYEQFKRKLLENDINSITDENDLQATNLNDLISTVNDKLRDIQFDNSYKVSMKITSNIHENLNENIIINKILDLFPHKINNYKSNQINVNGVFYIPNIQISYLLLNNLILYNDIYSKVLAIDERSRIPKPEYGIKIQFLGTTTTFNLDFDKIDNSNTKLMSKDENLKVDTNYIKIYVSDCKNVLEISRYKLILCKLLSLYPKYSKIIINNYKEFLDIQEYLQNETHKMLKGGERYVRTKKLLKDINPEQFISGYARYGCQKESAPKIVAEKINDEIPNEVKELNTQGYQVMLFPKNPDEGKQYYYACNNNSRYKFPGLKQNKLSNNEKYPVFPCCYSTDHGKRKQSLYKKYYKDELSFNDLRNLSNNNKKEDDRHIYTTNKFLPNNRLGLLSKDIDLFFKSIDSINIYLRKGFEYNKNSILNVLNFATTTNNLSDNELRSDVLNFYKNNNISLYQEAYNLNTQKLINILNDTNEYIDVKLFYNLLIQYFNVNIYIFTVNDEYPAGILNTPYNINGYINNNKKSTNVLIYEYWGGETDNATYPQYELIVKLNDINDKKYVYIYENEYEIIKRINYLYNFMWGYNYHNIDVATIFKTTIKNYDIDFYGKTRFLQLNDIIIICEPLNNLNIKKNNFILKNNNYKQVLEFLKYEKINNIKNVVNNDILIGIKFNKNNINFYIPIEPFKSPTSINTTTNENYPIFNNKSILNKYLYFDKLSRLLTEYTLFMFSLYYHKNKSEITTDYIINFSNKYFTIDENYVYNLSNITRNFNSNNSLIVDNKLVIPNKIVLKKLLYILRLHLKDDYENTLNYRDVKYINNFYNDIRDFNTYSTEILIENQLNLIKFIENKINNYNLYDTLKLQSNNIEETLYGIYNNSESNHYKKTTFVLIFYAEWNKMCKLIQNRIFDIFGKNKKYTELSKQYTKVGFVYIDVDKNKNLVYKLDINSIPFFITYKLDNNKFVMHQKILGDENNLFENIKRIKNSIDN